MSAPHEPRRWVDEPSAGPAQQLLARSLEATPADTSAKARVWRGIADALDTSPPRRTARWRAPALAVAALLVLLVALRWWPSAPAPTARLELTAGEVSASTPEGTWTSAEADRVLSADARLKTGPRATAVLRLPRAAVALSGQAELRLESVGERTRLRLSGGVLTAQVEPRKTGQSFVVETERYRVTVKGTVFSVEERAPDDVKVTVTRGRVEVSGPTGVVEVPAGRSWHSVQPAASSPVEGPHRDEALLALATREGPRGTVRVDGPGDAIISEDGLTLGPAPLTWRAPAGPHRLASRSGADAAMALEVEAAEGEVRATSFRVATSEAVVGQPAADAERQVVRRPPIEVTRRPEVTRRAEVHPSRPGSTKLKPRQRGLEGAGAGRAAGEAYEGREAEEAPTAEPEPALYETAVQLARDGRYEEAATAFKEVAAHDGPRAELALYGLGRIQQANLGRPREALATFERYRRHYPRGTMIQEVEISTIELQLQQRDYTAALASMGSFLARHPSSERSAEVHLLRGNIERERGNCGAALDDYALATTGAHTDDAVFFTGWCQQHLGRTELARRTWRGYLTRFPSGRHVSKAKAALGLGATPECRGSCLPDAG